MSDQDFFFDEDEKPAQKQASPAAKPASKQPTKTAPTKTAPATSVVAPSGGIELTWTVTALIGAVALLLGVIVGYAIPKNTATVGAGTVNGTAVQSAPQLTPEQMQGGELPAGHPDIGGATGSGTATGSAAPTASTAP